MPETIGPFRIVRLLGEGGMGRVFLGASSSGRQVAVKVVRPELASDAGFRRRFKAEVEAAMAVSGAFTTPVVDADPEGALPWLATVYVPGPSLQAEIDARGPMAEPEVRVLGARLAEALAAVHRAGLIHRDLKPSNILLAGDGPRVIDFGISRASEGTVLTVTGGVVGSAGYMSPEQVAGHELTPASDVFALGAVVVFAATGRHAFGTGPFQVLMFRAAYEPPQLDGVPEGLAELVAACLEKDPARRPPVAGLPELFAAADRIPAPRPEASASPETAPAVPLQQPLSEPVSVLAVPLLPPAPVPPTQVSPPALTRRQTLLGGAALALTGTAAVVALSPLVRGRGRSTEGAKPSADATDSGLQPVWEASVGEEYGELVLAGDVVLSIHKGMDALSPADGKEVWESTAHDAFYPAKYRDGRVYLIADGEISALSAQTGEELWISELDGGVPESPLPIASSLLVVRDKEQRAHGFDPETGRWRWTLGTADEPFYVNGDPCKGVMLIDTRFQETGNSYAGVTMSSGRKKWTRLGKLLARCTDGKRFYVLDEDLKVRALDPLTGKEIWSSPSGMPLYRPKKDEPDYWLSFADGLLIGTCSTPGRLAVFDSATGRRLWKPKPIDTATFALSGRTFCSCETKSLRAIDVRTGRPLWEVELTGSGSSALDFSLREGLGGQITIASREGLQGRDLATGRETWSYAAEKDSPYEWRVLRVPGRLLAKHEREVYAFDFPGEDATTLY